MKRLSVSMTIAAILLTGLLSGCVATTPFRKMAASDDKVSLYVFRPESLLSRGTIIAVTINDLERGLLLNNAYLPINTEPGDLEIKLLTNDFRKSKYDSMKLSGTRSGETYFVKADPGLMGAFTLVKLDPDKGFAEIGNTVMYEKR